MRNTIRSGLLLLLALSSCLSPQPDSAPIQLDEFTILGPRNYLSGYPALNADGSVNAVIEIPAGSTARWEVDERDGLLRWEFEQGRPRHVEYLPYPANHGMVPGTRLSAEMGGDGDPLDVVVLGPALQRGAVVHVRPIGLLELLDNGEREDKLIAVMDGAPMAEVESLSQLLSDYKGVSTILRTWFQNYMSAGRMEARGFTGPEEAQALLEAATREFHRHAAGG